MKFKNTIIALSLAIGVFISGSIAYSQIITDEMRTDEERIQQIKNKLSNEQLEKYKSFGQYINDLNTKQDKLKNNAIKEVQFDKNLYYIQNLSDEFITDKNEALLAAFEYTLNRAALYEMAKELDVAITIEEASQIGRETYELIKSNQTATPERDLAIMEGLGLSEEEYWTEYAAESNQVHLSISNLYESVINPDLPIYHDYNVNKMSEINSNAIKQFKSENQKELNQFINDKRLPLEAKNIIS